MDVVEFFKTVNRLCKNQSGCEKCPVYKNGIGCMVDFDDDAIKSIDETVSKVEQWAKDHPVKTRQSEFLKMFPNADIDCILPCDLYKNLKRGHCHDDDVGCFYCKQDYWNEELTDND